VTASSTTGPRDLARLRGHTLGRSVVPSSHPVFIAASRLRCRSACAVSPCTCTRRRPQCEERRRRYPRARPPHTRTYGGVRKPGGDACRVALACEAARSAAEPSRVRPSHRRARAAMLCHDLSFPTGTDVSRETLHRWRPAILASASRRSDAWRIARVGRDSDHAFAAARPRSRRHTGSRSSCSLSTRCQMSERGRAPIVAGQCETRDVLSAASGGRAFATSHVQRFFAKK